MGSATNPEIVGGTAPLILPLQAANNLSDISSPTAALGNIGGISGGKLVATAQTGNFSLVLPANAMIDNIVIQETAGHAVTGGIKIGTTSGAVDVASALTVTASFLGVVPVASLLKQIFSTILTQTLFFQAVGAWNSASVNVTILYRNLA